MARTPIDWARRRAGELRHAAWYLGHVRELSERRKGPWPDEDRQRVDARIATLLADADALEETAA